MVEFEVVGGSGKVLINPAMVEAIEESPAKIQQASRAGIKLASGKLYHVEGSPAEVVTKLFPAQYAVPSR